MTHQQRPTGLSIGRLIAAHVLILGIVGSSVYDIATEQEHFPFSNYPMFSTVHRTPTLRWYRLFGVTTDGREVALLKYSQLWPLDQSRLLWDSVESIRAGNETRPAKPCRTSCGDTSAAAPPASTTVLLSAAYACMKSAGTSSSYAANLGQPGSRELIAEVGDSTDHPSAPQTHYSLLASVLFTPAPPTNLAIGRLLFFGGLTLFYVPRDFSGWGDVSPSLWQPIWLFDWFHLPFSASRRSRSCRRSGNCPCCSRASAASPR
jgi:hypothetical protein